MHRRRDCGLSIIGGTANPRLAAAVARACGVSLSGCLIARFPDGELHVELLAQVRDDDVYIVQPTGPPVDANLVELLLVADACRRAGAARVTAVVPYLGYARQDRRSHGREPLSARLVADLLDQAGIARLIVVDVHSRALEGCFRIPLEQRTAVPVLAAAAESLITRETTIVAPDLGAVTLAEQYARRLERPVVVIHKTRSSGTAVTASCVFGDVRGRDLLIVDDMITVGATIEAAARAALGAGAREGIVVAATHALFAGDALARMARLPLRKILATDSTPPLPDEEPVERVSIAGLLGETIVALHDGSRGRDAAGLPAPE